MPRSPRSTSAYQFEQPYQFPQKSKKDRKKKQIIIASALVVLLLITALLIFLNPCAGGNKDPAALSPPYVIALDAGHGGSDVGAQGIVQEYVMTEQTVTFLQEMLESDENYKPILCRQAGESASINERSQVARRKNAALLLSVHGNSDTAPDTTGFECFPAPPGRFYHDLSYLFAEYIADEFSAAGANMRGEAGIRYVYYTPGSETEKIFREASDETVYDEKSFGVVEDSECPAVLAEQCFITSKSDMNKFGDDDGCYLSAQCYYYAICNYFSTTPVAM